MPTVFKVNHKYSGNEGRLVWVCLSICEGYTWMMCLNGIENKGSPGPGYVYKMSDIEHWTEVFEPRREFFNAYVGLGKKTVYRGPYDNRQDADHCICFGPNDFEGYYGTLELIHHSDNGTREGGSYKVESIFHMVARK